MKANQRLYWTTRHVTTYASETRVLKESMKWKLLVTERKILRRIFGPTKDRGGTWGIKLNDELNNLIRNKNTTNNIKAQRLSWSGHDTKWQVIGW
jgi:hypothetical protein